MTHKNFSHDTRRNTKMTRFGWG